MNEYKNKSEKSGIFLMGAIAAVWSFFACIIMILLVFLNSKIDYMCKRYFMYPNLVLLLIGLSIAVCMYLLYLRNQRKIDTFFGKLPKYTIIFSSISLFLIEAYVFYNMYFITGWDSNIIVSAALETISGDQRSWNWYYSMYPNNLFLTWIYALLFKFNANMGNTAEYAYIAILLQCILACITGGLLFSIVKNVLNTTYAYFAWGIYVMHIALNPWISILYSDAMALVFPVLILWIFQLSKRTKDNWKKWFIIGCMAFVGAEIKPQVYIVLIAIVLVDIIEVISHLNKKNLMNKFKNYTSMVVAAVFTLLICNDILYPSVGMDLDKERIFGYSHFIMMGLNEERNGIYSEDDVNFSGSFAMQEDREEGNWNVIKERLDEMGVSGLTNHLIKKNLVTYGDGSYAWMAEGGFFHQEYEDRNDWISPKLKSLYYGDDYIYFSTFQQIIWITLLFGSCGVLLHYIFSKERNLTIYAMSLSLIGLTLFEMIFEARARYLFIYSPFYIIVALVGYIGFREAIQKIVIKMRNNNIREK